MSTITDFKLTGLSKKHSLTCEPLHNENIFWPKSKLTQDRFDAFWDYFVGRNGSKFIAEIEHDGLYEDGTPINPFVIGIRRQ